MAKKKTSKKPNKGKPKAKKPAAKNAASAATPKIERFQQLLRCELTEKEVAEAAKGAAEKLALRDNKVEQLKAANEHAKAEVKDLEAEMRRLSGIVREGAERRSVVCERRFDHIAKTVTDTRTDTGETIYARAMTESELQTELPFKDIGDEFDDDPGDGLGDPPPPDEKPSEPPPESKPGEDDDKPEAAE